MCYVYFEGQHDLLEKENEDEEQGTPDYVYSGYVKKRYYCSCQMSESPTSCPSGSRSKRSDVRDIRCKTAEKSVSNSSLSTVKKTKMTTIPTKLLSSDSIETTPARFNSSFRSKKTKTPTIPSKLPSSDKIGLPPVPPKISTKTPMSKADTPQRRRRISSAGKVLHDRALRKTSRKSTSSRWSVVI